MGQILGVKVKVTVNENVKIVFLLISSSKVDRFTSAHNQNDHRPIPRISVVFHQRKFVFVISIRDGRMPQRPYGRGYGRAPTYTCLILAQLLFIPILSFYRVTLTHIGQMVIPSLSINNDSACNLLDAVNVVYVSTEMRRQTAEPGVHRVSGRSSARLTVVSSILSGAGSVSCDANESTERTETILPVAVAV